jgi:hypothetical protein
MYVMEKLKVFVWFLHGSGIEHRAFDLLGKLLYDRAAFPPWKIFNNFLERKPFKLLTPKSRLHTDTQTRY